MKPKDLRDEFALAVIDTSFSGVMEDIARGFTPTIDGKEVDGPVFAAHVCYRIADAMMAEREKTP